MRCSWIGAEMFYPIVFLLNCLFWRPTYRKEKKTNKLKQKTKHRLSILGLHFPHLDKICTTTTALTNFRLSLVY